MKLYYSPGACSMATHIMLHETGTPHSTEAVNLSTKQTAGGQDYRQINPKGVVPALVLDDGQMLTECAALLQYVPDQAGRSDLIPACGTLERARLHEMLSYLGGELHKTYGVLFNPALAEDARAAQLKLVDAKLKWIEDRLADDRDYLLGSQFSPADAYLFVITNWSGLLGHDLSGFPRINALRDRVGSRPAVQATLKAEGLA